MGMGESWWSFMEKGRMRARGRGTWEGNMGDGGCAWRGWGGGQGGNSSGGARVR
jgi:hypothetical protein